jgi:hypothetical protein
MSTKRNARRFGYVLAGVLVAIATVGAVGAAMGAIGGSADPRIGAGGHTGDPVTYAGVTQAPTGAPASLDDAAGQVLRGVGGTSVQGVQASSSSTGLVVTVALKENNDDVPDIWLADLAVGALGERMRTNQAVINEEIASATAVGLGSSGVQVTSNLGLGAVRLGQVFESPSDAALTSQVNTVAQEFGLKVSSLSILHPLESALRVTFVVPDSATIDWTIDQLRTAVVGASPDVEGVLIELDNSAGQPLLRSGVAYRTGEGGLWFAPGQDDRFGAVHGGTPAG